MTLEFVESIAVGKLLRESEWHTPKYWDKRQQTLDSLVRLGIAVKDGDKYKRKFKVL